MSIRESRLFLICHLSCLVLIFNFVLPQQLSACTTFKLQKGDGLIYGHNLNQGDIGVPGLIFINKRGIFKLGRTWSELTTKERLNPSSHCWISRYGSVTFNNFGRDFPDGGMNEVGLYIWEMSEDIEYPKNDSLPKLNQMNWMQYILDNYSTVEEAIQCASEIEIDGWGWHYFVGDAKGNTAAIAFIDGKVVVNKGENMPIPGLFNTPYNRELELLKYFKGFGGLYEPDLSDPGVPRFVKTAVMIRNYEPAQNIVDYGFKMLDTLKVFDVPEWSIVFDVRERHVYFKTRINPEIKSFSMDEIDFSNKSPVLILNMDIREGGDVFDQFHPYSNEEMRDFTKKFMFPILPEKFFTSGGITQDEYLERISTHSDAAALAGNQFFKGVWKLKPDKANDETEIILEFVTKAGAVFGRISPSEDAEESYTLDHIHLIGNHLKFTFETNGKGNEFLEVLASIDEEKMNITVHGIEENYGSYLLIQVSNL
jgi:penicillin V acylase-like amidase (Ntn superfamily)